jgi:Domain of unknown function (DUF4384)
MNLRHPRSILVICAGLALPACQALPPVVSKALVGFGQDVLAAAAQNFAPQYAASVQNLFYAMAETATGMPFAQTPDNAEATDGYVDETYAGEDVYAQETYAGDTDQGSYDAVQYPQENHSGGDYGQEDYTAGYSEEPYGNTSTGGMPVAQQGVAGISLEVALLAQQRTSNGQVRMRPVQDGDVLYDGRGDPARGDKIKIFFAANCACYVYVIGIDATGYVASIFPEGGGHATSRVQPGERYLVPDGTTWWGLDDYRGVEQIYFIVSRERRLDIENQVANLAGQRPPIPANYRPVQEPAIVPTTRGLVQVQSAAPAAVPTEYGSEQISPTSFQSTVADADLVVTRWFRHE